MGGSIKYLKRRYNYCRGCSISTFWSKFIDVQIGFGDQSGTLIKGEGKKLALRLERQHGGFYSLAKYWTTDYSNLLPSTEIKILEDNDDFTPNSQPSVPLHINGFGRLLVSSNSSIDSVEIDLPAFVKPDRHSRNGQKIGQDTFLQTVERIGAQNSVVPGNGEVIFQKYDMNIPGRGISFGFNRTYRSANDYPGPLGHGWNHSWNVFLWKEDDNEVRILFENGFIGIFKRMTSSDEWKPSAGIFGKLEEGENGISYKLLMPMGYKHIFLPISYGRHLFTTLF